MIGGASFTRQIVRIFVGVSADGQRTFREFDR
jgi:hypothetical protein